MDVQRDLALLAHVHRLQVLLALQGTLLAVSPLRLLFLVQLGGDNPVVESVIPGLGEGTGDAIPLLVINFMNNIGPPYSIFH